MCSSGDLPSPSATQRNCTMASQTIGIIVNGATGRIGSTQHLANALIPIIAEGGLALGHYRLVPRLLLAGRDPERKLFESQLQHLADHDPLTGLVNRRRFGEELAAES